MNNNVMLISEAETFTIKGLEMKLQGIGANINHVLPKMKHLEGKFDTADLIILCTDESIGNNSTTLVYIKDQCADLNRQIVVVGTKREYEVVQTFIPKRYILGFFEKPLNIERLLDTAEEQLESRAREARKKSILIVDDDPQYMKLIKEWLSDDYRVSMATSGMNAITWLAMNKADLILLDYEMPVTNGPQVLEMIRSEPLTAVTPVMFLTGNSSKSSIMQVLKLKPADYLLKTIDKEGLLKKLGDFFYSHDAKVV